MTAIGYYLIGVNVIGFLYFAIPALFHARVTHRAYNVVAWILSIIGGTVGILLGMLFFHRKTVKENVLSRVMILCLFVIQVIVVLIMKGRIVEHPSFAFWRFFADHKIALTYWIVINILAVILYAADKIKAIKHKNRIKIVTLLGVAFIGGSVGSYLAMFVFHHKTKKNYFTIGIPVMMLMQILVVFYVMNMA